MRSVISRIAVLATVASLFVLLGPVSAQANDLSTASSDPAEPGVSTQVDVEQTVGTQTSVGNVAVDKSTVDSFSMVGVTWDRDPSLGDVTVDVRVRIDGTWGDWETLEVDHDGGTVGNRDSSELWWLDATANGVQARLTSTTSTPQNVEVTTIDPGKGPTARPDLIAAATTASIDGTTRDSIQRAAGSVSQPPIISRAAWGAGPGTDCSAPTTVPTSVGVVIHHTVGSNSYSAAESAGIVRGIQAFHVSGRGWCDIGYNFLVDRYGQIFEGRKGGITNQVRGAHAGVFEVNTYTTGIAMMGTFTDVMPPAAMQDSVVKLVAWRASLFGWSPTSRYTLGGVASDAIGGHRDVYSTECPGNAAYPWLRASGGLRDRVISYLATNGVTAGFMQAPGDANIWLVRGNIKQHVPSVEVLNAYGGVGKIQQATAASLAAMTAGPELGYVVRSPETGGIYMATGGQLAHAPSCEMLADYGYPCSGLPEMASSQVATYPIPPELTSFAKSPDAADVYMVTDGVKQHIVSGATLDAFGGIAKVTTVSAGVLNSLSAGKTVGAVVKVPETGAVYTPVSGRLMHVPSCELLADFGSASCSDLPVMSKGVAASYASAGTLTSFVRTASAPSVYLVTDSTKQAFPDYATLQEFAATSKVSVVSDTLLSGLSTGPTLGKVIRVPETNTAYTMVAGTMRAFASCGVAGEFGFTCSTLPTISGGVAASYPKGGQITTIVKTANDSAVYMVSQGTRQHITTGASLYAFSAAVPLSVIDQWLLDRLSPGVDLGNVVQIEGDARPYAAMGGVLRPFSSCEVAADYGYTCGSVPTMSSANASLYRRGSAIGSFVRTASGSSVYLVTGGTKEHVISLEAMVAYGGFDRVSVVDDWLVVPLTDGPGLGRVVKDATTGQPYVASGGQLRPFASCEVAADYTHSCATMPVMDSDIVASFSKGATVGPFAKGVSGASIYLVTDGTKQHVTSGAVMNALGGFGQVSTVDDWMLQRVVDGSAVGQMVLVPETGGIYYINAGTAQHVLSCRTVGTYGYSCSNLPKMSPGVLGTYATGPDLP